MDNYRVTILLATFNRAHLIEETLNSIKSQTYTNWECIIVDDHSTDDTPKVVSSIISEDSRFSYFLKTEAYKKGLSGTRNYGLDIAESRKARFIQFFDDDDLMHPQKLELQIIALLKDENTMLSLCGFNIFVDVNDIQWEGNRSNFDLGRYTLGEAYLLGVVRFVAQVPLFRFNYIKSFRFDEDLLYAEEWALLSMIFLKTNPKYDFINKILFFRRKHEDSLTERKDTTFSRRKTSAIINIKIFDFLASEKIHTKTTLFYFTKIFLLYKYNIECLNRIRGILKEKNYSFYDYLKFEISLKIYLLIRKLILRIINC